MSQEELGEQISKTKGAISTYEKGASYPSVEALVALARLFEVKIDDLLLVDFTRVPPSAASKRTMPGGLSERERLELTLEMQKNENNLLRKQLEDLQSDKTLQQDQIKKLWDLLEEYRQRTK